MFVFNDDARAGHETVCRSAVLRVGLSARPKVQAGLAAGQQLLPPTLEPVRRSKETSLDEVGGAYAESSKPQPITARRFQPARPHVTVPRAATGPHGPRSPSAPPFRFFSKALHVESLVLYLQRLQICNMFRNPRRRRGHLFTDLPSC